MKVIIVGGIDVRSRCEVVGISLKTKTVELKNHATGELPRDREVQVICRSAGRAYYATRILLQNGFKVRNISGGILSRSMIVVGEK